MVIDHCYDLGVYGQDQIYIESALQLATQITLVFLTEVFSILYTDCQYDT